MLSANITEYQNTQNSSLFIAFFGGPSEIHSCWRRIELYVIRFHQQFLGSRILHGLIMSLFPKVFTLHRLLLLSTPSPPSRLFKLDDESSCAVAISSASRWARLCVFTFSSTLNLKWCGYWMCARFTTLKIGVMTIYGRLPRRKANTLPKMCVKSIPWRQPIELIKQMCQTLSLRGIACVPF